jgi:hypothetical protein
MLAAAGFPLTRMPVRLAQGRPDEEGGDLSIGRPSAFTNGQLAASTHSSLANSTRPGSRRLRLA